MGFPEISKVFKSAEGVPNADDNVPPSAMQLWFMKQKLA